MGPPDVLGEKELLPYAEAQCMMEIPITREVEDLKEDSRAQQSKYESATASSKDTLQYLNGNKNGKQSRQEEEQVEKWAFPVKFIIKQRHFEVGKDFKKQESLEIYISQNTKNPNENDS